MFRGKSLFIKAPLFVGLLLSTWFIKVAAGAQPKEGQQARRHFSCQDSDSVWKRALHPDLAEYCHAVAFAQAAMHSDARRAARYAEKAQAIFPGGLEANMLLAESRLLVGDARAAHAQFSALLEATAEQDRERLPAFSRLAVARAALLAGDYGNALYWYRRAVLRLDDVAGSRNRAKVFVEAATAATYHTPPLGREARSYLRLAMRQNAPLLHEVVLAAWVASLLRDGLEAEASSWAGRLPNSASVSYVFSQHRPSFGEQSDVLPVLPAVEGDALALAVAVLIEKDAISSHVAAFDAHDWELLDVPEHIENSVRIWEKQAP